MSDAYASELDDLHLAASLGTVTAIIYAGSFLLPACGDAFGFMAFLLAFLHPIGWPMWAANPVFWLGLVKLFNGKWRAARKAGTVAVLLAVCELFWFAGAVNVGYFVWVASMATLAWAGWYGEQEQRRMSAWPVDEAHEAAETSIRVLR